MPVAHITAPPSHPGGGALCVIGSKSILKRFRPLWPVMEATWAFDQQPSSPEHPACTVQVDHTQFLSLLPGSGLQDGVRPFLLLFCPELYLTLCDSLWTVACPTPLSFNISPGLLKLVSTELVILSKHLILRCPLLLLPSILPSIRVFSHESALCIRWPEY